LRKYSERIGWRLKAEVKQRFQGFEVSRLEAGGWRLEAKKHIFRLAFVNAFSNCNNLFFLIFCSYYADK
jgi:hypothetical protein